MLCEHNDRGDPVHQLGEVGHLDDAGVPGDHLSAALATTAGAQVAQVAATDSTFPEEMVALRDFDGTASWRDVTVTALP